uniref:Uncharacterized protein n=1 Tax=Amphora coffeiformis TaxID=265554 RepID=A0A6S8M2G0_9STRA|mmetsp:Transcript_16629/g.33536  ORF Transcript_16629/g.33536 Transcript_16629/m.33536 type:complete len:427 (+) Transcript_16629:605-1885(+)|eukprot:scaffold4786_cov198-Amphora_coffeaeformis.AAC.12
MERGGNNASSCANRRSEQPSRCGKEHSTDTSENPFCFRSMAMAHPPLTSFQRHEPELKQTGAVNNNGGGFMDLSHLLPHIPSINPKPLPVSKIVPTPPAGWAVDKLTRLGYYHPLEPCHVDFPKARLNDMLKQLPECLRLLSCQVSYEDRWLAAACKTMEQVEFQVSFFEDRKDTQVVFIELQRRCGDSYVFHQDYVQPILAVVQRVKHGQAVDATPTQPCRISGMDLDSLLAEHCEQATDDDVTLAIELATNLVMADRIDALRLGMESLEVLTDTSKTGMSTARKVARVLVVPADEASHKLVHILLRYITDESEDQEEDIRFRALQVWSNTWQVAADDMECPLESFCDVFCSKDTLVRSLMSRVEHVREQPHEATLALRGLEALCRKNDDLLSEVSWPAVEQAKDLGAAENVALEQACRKFLKAR